MTTKTESRYKVRGTGKYYKTAEEAITQAKETASKMAVPGVAVVYDVMAIKVIAIVTDDANGIKIHTVG